MRKTVPRLKETRKKGFLSSIRNPKGKKAPVSIVNRVKTGWTPTYSKSNRKVQGFKSARVPEGLARRVARKGHKKVTIRD